jgi:PleD family two-component response regulator
MMYFLEQEYYRFKACNYPVVLGLFDFGVVAGGQSQPVPASYIKQIGHRISRAKRRIDHFGHFGDTICALMLPHTEYDAGNKVAERIKKIIQDDAQHRGLPFFIKMGVAGMPIHANDVNGLINEAAARMG